ncbi:MAG TPA: DPP IV N-terminal domain-containing protein, partial [Anaerolineae bacterium]
IFSQKQNGNSDIYVLPVGQAEPVRLTTHPADDRDAVWSPDGREIAFASRRDGNWEIYVYNIPEGKLRQITHNPAYEGKPSWSADGQWLAYESYQNNNLDVYVVKTDLSQGPFRLTEDPGPDFAPVWSPGGRHVVFTSWRDGNKDIFLRALDDVFDEASVNLTTSPATHEDGAAFSPDGRYLAYSQQSAGFSVIYALPLATDYTIAGAPVSLGQQGYDPGWSPDGESLVFVHDREGTNYLVAGSPNAWGVTPQLYAASGPIDSPSWSALTLSPDMVEALRHIDGTGSDRPLFVEAIATPEADGPPVLLWELQVNAPSPYLSDRVDQSFAALRERVIEEAGWDFLGQLDNMFESIDSKPLPGQSNRTWNKAGRAFDLQARAVLTFEPQVEIVRQDIGAETYWRVYVRTAAQDGTQGEPLRDLPWNFRARFEDEPQYYEEGGTWKEAIPSGYYVDFTALAADYGWTWVPAAKNWRTFFPGIRFWHYENHQGLTWEEAMRELYTEDEMARAFGRP